MLYKVLTIDPGFNTGYAYWEKTLKPVVGSYKVPNRYKKETIECKMVLLFREFEIVLRTFDPIKCIIESVENWDSLKSNTASKRGDLAKLAYLVGGYSEICRKNGVLFELISARKWKGNLPNKVVEKRVTYVNGETYPNDHIACAVGIGLHKMGAF